MKVALQRRGRSQADWHALVAHCEALVAARVAAGTVEQRAALVDRVQTLLERADALPAG